MMEVTRIAGPLRGIRIDRRSPVPFYVQVKEAITAAIQGSNWKPGDRLPGELDLCQVFNVSRTVVRQALQELGYEGVIVREKGRGTFVAEPKFSSTSLVHSLVGFHQDMAERGFEPHSRILEQAMQPASPQVANYLHLQPLAPVIKLERLRYIGQEPIVLVTSYLPYELCPLAASVDFSDKSLYGFLKSSYQINLSRGRRRIEAVVATDALAEYFEINTGSPLIRMESVSFDPADRPVEYFVGFFRGDRSRFDMEVVRFDGQSDSAHLPPKPLDDDWLSS